MTILVSKEINPATAVELYRQPLSGPSEVAVTITNLLDGVVNPTEVLLVEAAAVGLSSPRSVNPGAGYTAVPKARFTSKANIPPVYAARMELDAVAVGSAGIGYVVGDLINLSEGQGTQAVLRVAEVDPNGRVVRFTITNRGSFDTLKPLQRNIKAIGGRGRHLYLHPTYRVARLQVVSNGSGFIEAPVIEIDGSARFEVTSSVTIENRHRVMRKSLEIDDGFLVKDLRLDPGDLIFVRAGTGPVAARVTT